MEFSEDITIKAGKDRVYAALNDPEILQRCIPGCETLTRQSETELDAVVVLKIGPVKARFKGQVTLDTEGAPDRFTLTGQGNGGTAGRAKGSADVTLHEEDGITTLSYIARAEIAGKIAQLGSRLVQGSARKLSGQFFDALADVLNETGES